MRSFRIFILFLLISGPLVALLVFLRLIMTKDLIVAIDIFKGFIASSFLLGLIPAIITGAYVVFAMNKITWQNLIATTLGISFSLSTIFGHFLFDEPSLILGTYGAISTSILLLGFYFYDHQRT